MSESDTSTSLPGAPMPPTRQRPGLFSGWGRWLLLAGLAALFLPQLPGCLQYEWQMWRAAPLLADYNEGFTASPPDTAAMQLAHDQLSRIMGEDCHNSTLLMQRLQWREELRDYDGALEDLDEISELQRESGGSASRGIRYMRCNLLLLNGKKQEALEVSNTLLDSAADTLSEFEIASTRWQISPYDWNAVNFAAYVRAILGVELDEALDHIQRAIDNAGAIPEFLDTRGFVHHKRGENDKALADIQGAIDAFAPHEDWEKYFEKHRSEATSLTSLKAKYKREMKNVAVIYYHRGLVYQAMGRGEDARKDFDHVRELGYKPSPDLF